MRSEKKRMDSNTERLMKKLIDTPPSPTDPAGSYTGKPVDPAERPVQDADDL